MKPQTTKIQIGKGILKTTIPKTICDLAELEKGDTIEWNIQNNQIIITKRKTFKDIPTIHQPDNNGICYQHIIKRTKMHIIAYNKNEFQHKQLLKHIRNKYGFDILLEDIPNDFVQYEIYNPENIEVQYISWFEDDITLQEEFLVEEIQQFKK